jgi:type II secretion system protein N
MKTKILKAVVYPLFFLLCLAYFVVRGFPIHLVADKLTRAAEQQLGMRVTNDGIATLFPNGVRVRGIRLIQEAEDEGPGLVIPVEQVSARVSLLGLITGRRELSFQAELLSGRLDGTFDHAPEKIRVQASLAGLELARLPIWQRLMNLDLAGQVTGELDLALDPKDLKSLTGNLRLELLKGALGEGTIKGLSIPKIGLGKTQLAIEAGKGKADIKTFKVQSDDLEADLTESYLLLQKDAIQTNARGKVRFKLSEEFLNKNPKFKDIIALGGLNQARGDDGFFTYQLFGRIDHLQFRPQRGGAGVRPGGVPTLPSRPRAEPELE